MPGPDHFTCLDHPRVVMAYSGTRLICGHASHGADESRAQAITCPVCRMTSWNPRDVLEGYCSRCYGWTSGHQSGSAIPLAESAMCRHCEREISRFPLVDWWVDGDGCTACVKGHITHMPMPDGLRGAVT